MFNRPTSRKIFAPRPPRSQRKIFSYFPNLAPFAPLRESLFPAALCLLPTVSCFPLTALSALNPRLPTPYTQYPIPLSSNLLPAFCLLQSALCPLFPVFCFFVFFTDSTCARPPSIPLPGSPLSLGQRRARPSLNPPAGSLNSQGRKRHLA